MKRLELKGLLSLLVFLLGFGVQSAFANHGEDEEYGDREYYEDYDDEEEEDELDVSPREALQFLRKHLPRWYDELRDLKDEEPDEYRDELEDFAWFVQDYRDLKEEDPEFAELTLNVEKMDHDLDGLVEEYHESERKAERNRLEKEISAAVEKSFDIESELHEHEMAFLEEEIEELREMQKHRTMNKTRILKNQLRELLEDDSDEDDEGDDDEEDHDDD